MHRYNKSATIIISAVMIISIMLSPFCVVHANAPLVKPPADIKPPAALLPKPADRIIPGPVKVETAARAQGVKYALKPGVEKLPSSMDYKLEQITLDKLLALEGGAQVTPDENLDISRVKGIKYKPGSKFMVLPQNASSTFTPKANKIYIDEEKGLAYKVLEDGKTDTDGNKQYVVETPGLTDIFQSYNIPKQDINLTTGNIAYLAPGAKLDPRSGMNQKYIASADDGFISNVKHEGNKHIITLTPGKMLFKYPSKSEEEKTPEEKQKEEKEKFEGDWWEQQQYSDLRGFEEKDELKVEIAIKEGTIIVEDPTFHADFDLNWLTTKVKADFYFESKTKADVTVEGDLKFDKSVETCVFGYDINLGSVAGEEKGNRAFVGIFLVLGVNGEVHVEARAVATGDARAGYAYNAYGYGLLPYYVGPYVTYNPTGFDATFNANGEIHAVLACVPQVGVIIWGTEIGALQLWLGLKTDAEMSASGGISTDTSASISSKGSLDIKAFSEMVGYLFDKRYSIFYIDFPIYHGEWDVGMTVSGGGGDLVREATPSFFVKADASTNIVEGRIEVDSKPFAEKAFNIEVRNSGQLKNTLSGLTDGEGSFKINSAAYNIIPSDRLVVSVPEGEYLIENIKYEVAGKSREIKPTVPFNDLDFSVDAFNDLITGTVSGRYSGPVNIAVTNRNNIVTNYTVNAVNGVFNLSIPINQNITNVRAAINFEGTNFPEGKIVYRVPGLDALDIHFVTEFEQVNVLTTYKTDVTCPSGVVTKPPLDKSNLRTNKDDEGNKLVKPVKVFGTITNKAEIGPVQIMGEGYTRNISRGTAPAQPYMGSVKISSLPIGDVLLNLLNNRAELNAYNTGWTATVQAKRAVIDGIATSTVNFEFVNPDAMAYTLEIEHEGFKKVVIYDPFVFHYEKTQQDILGFTNRRDPSSIINERIDSVINPGDMMDKVNQGGKMQ